MTAPVYLSRPMTMRQAAVHLGWPDTTQSARRLTYLIRARAPQALIGGGQGRKLLTTVAALRRYFPELVDDLSYLHAMAESHSTDIVEEIGDMRAVARRLAAVIRGHASRISALEA